MLVEPFISDIYEAAIVPEKWQGVLDRLAELADAEGTLLFAAGPGVPRWVSSAAIEHVVVEWTRSKWFLDNPRGKRLVPLNEPRFLTDFDALTIEEIEASAYYTELLRPRGLGWCVGTSIRSPSGDTLVFSIEKANMKGPVPREVAARLDELRPHLARAALLSARLGLDRAATTVATLEMIGLPAAAVTDSGKVVAVNAGLSHQGSGIEVAANDMIRLASPAAQEMLMQAIARNSASARSLGRSIPVGATKRAPPSVVHVLPLRGAGLDIFSGAISIVFVTPVVPNSSFAPELLGALFDLSPAEARIASQLTDGSSIEEIAISTGLSHNTIRSQLKSVFSKTGVQRQAELVSLLGETINLPG
ncbi:helix-turn-helix transcriptional regulator [Bradyrhizobium sp. 40]|uniref:helix-turn-helix transcriptional regulator n=1 Tax=Bradyrhizobium sp. 40 TaxID=2782674 RepID=UPI001FFE9F89|nr:helix-turn-helix transcriptional regulator [Bradyrhizobium sp. 40]UPJ41120.1 helix-turn-helix transcriptional regulator [Bradyrhizobium sp. 40]